MRVGDREIGPGQPPIVVAEIGIAHEGELRNAIEYVGMAAELGADAVKMQYQMPATDLAEGHPWFESLLHCNLRRDEHVAVRRYARECGLLYGCTPFCAEAVERIVALEPDYIKIGGAGWQSRPLVSAVASSGVPVMASSGCGGAFTQSLDGWMRLDKPLPLFCASSYPTRAAASGLGWLRDELRGEELVWVWGLSDHSATPYAGLAAIALGASVVEVHFPKAGPDASSSLDAAQLRTLCEGARWIWEAMQSNAPQHDPEVVRLATHGVDGRRGA